LAVSTLLVQRSLRADLYADISSDLLNQARLVGTLVARDPGPIDTDVEAHALGRLIHARVTFIAADGKVLGDSEVDRDKLDTLENPLTREEVQAAMIAGEGTGRRTSHTTGLDTMYAAVSTSAGSIAFVRVALPLTTVDQRVAGVRRLALVG